ncbi:DUF1269 domain-containing protein [Kocuria arenosa]|uniref:DUF1269 domain-containing protein n=1 Tax=Kocuria arenosa TaxID=3071446 RepID=UPI0034D67605
MTEALDRKILAATFAGPDGAPSAATVLAGGVAKKITNTAVLIVGPDGKVNFVETKDWGPGRGALLGGALGLIAGPLGMLTVGGLGALAAKLRDSGFPDQQLEKLGHQLAPNSSAIVVDVAGEAVGTVQDLLRPLNVIDVVVADIDANVARLFDEQAEPVSG